MKYLLIILLFSCGHDASQKFLSGVITKEKDSYVVLNRPDFPDDYHQIEYIGDWAHMTIEEHGKTGSYAGTNQDTARFKFWGYGVQIRTELMSHHDSVQVIIDRKHITTINVNSPVNTTHNLVYSNMELSTGNHILELVPDGGYFVLNTLTIYYYIDPTPDPELPCDSTAIKWIEKIRWIEKDTLIISYKDSTRIHYDTSYYEPQIFIDADGIIYKLK